MHTSQCNLFFPHTLCAYPPSKKWKESRGLQKLLWTPNITSWNNAYLVVITGLFKIQTELFFPLSLEITCKTNYNNEETLVMEASSNKQTKVQSNFISFDIKIKIRFINEEIWCADKYSSQKSRTQNTPFLKQ